MDIRLFTKITKLASDADGLTTSEWSRLRRELKGKCRSTDLYAVHKIIRDLFVSPKERPRLESILKINVNQPGKQKLNGLIGSDGKKILRGHLSSLLTHARQLKDIRKRSRVYRRIRRHAKDAEHLLPSLASAHSNERLLRIKKLLAKTLVAIACRAVIRAPRLLSRVPKPLVRKVIARTIAYATRTNKDISFFLSLIPTSYYRDTKLMLPLLKRRPQYIAIIAPLLALVPKPLALTAYRHKITKAARFPNAASFARIMSNHIHANLDVHDPRPLAVVIYPTADHNVVFRTNDISKMTKGYFVRYYEVNDESEAIAALKDATKRRKASLVVIGGHGTKTELSFGAPDPAKNPIINERFYLDTGDRKDLAGIGSRIENDASIILHSCSNGKGGKAAANLANFMAGIVPHASIYAAMSSGSIELTFDRNGLFEKAASTRAKIMVTHKRRAYYREYAVGKDAPRVAIPRNRTNVLTTRKRARLLALKLKRTEQKLLKGNATVSLKLKRLIKNIMYRQQAPKHPNDYKGIKAAIPVIISIVRSIDDYDARNAALSDLSSYFNPSVKHYSALLNDQDPDVRKFTLDELGSMWAKKERVSKLLPIILPKLNDSDAYVRASALEVLVHIKYRRLTPVLRRALKDRNEDIRNAAVRHLGELLGPSALPDLIRMARDPSTFVRVTTIWYLAKIKDRRATNIVLAALKDTNVQVRAAAFQSAIKARLSQVMPLLSRAFKDPASDVRKAAVEGASKLKDPRTVPLLVKAVGDRAAEVRIQAIRALYSIADFRAVPAFVRAMNDTDAEVRDEAAKSLGWSNFMYGVNSRQVIAVLAAVALLNPHARVRKRAITILGERDDPKLIPLFVEAMKNSDANVRREAVKALKKINTAKAKEALKKYSSRD